jgi:DNA-binding SARP family transcriptional activator
MTRPPGRLARLGRASAALAGLAAVLGGPPCVLVRLTGWPVPHHLPGWPQVQAFLTSPLSDDAIITGLACAVWLLWAMAVITVLVEITAALTGHRAPRLPVIAPFQAVAAFLIGATIVISLPHAAPRPAQPLHAALNAHTLATAPLTPGQPVPHRAPDLMAAPQAAGDRDQPAALPPVYRVVPGDDLWAIADRYLGNGERWHELYAINAGRPQPDGSTLTDPNLIYPGWVLLLAPPATSPSPPAGPAPPPVHTPAPAPSPSATRPATVPSATPQRDAPDHTRSPADAGQHPHSHSRPAAVRLPSGALIGISVALLVAAALILARVQRRRRYRPRTRLTPSIQPDEPPLPAVIAALRRAARPALPSAGDDAGLDYGAEPVTDPYLDLYDDTLPGKDHGHHLPGAEPGPRGQADKDPDPASTAGTSGRALGSIPLGVRGTREAVLNISALGGLGLTGPGAPAAARGILAALLAQAPPAGAAAPPAIIIPAADLARLLPGDPSAPIPGVSAPASLSAALDEMETALLRHARTTGALDTGDDPTIPIAMDLASGPAVALIATADPAATQRLRGILASGRALGAAAIILGRWPAGVTCRVAVDGVISDVTPPGGGLDGIRLFHLGADDAAAIAALLRDAGGVPRSDPHLPKPASAPASARPPADDLPWPATDDRRAARLVPSGYLPAPITPAPLRPADPPARPAPHAADAPAGPVSAGAGTTAAADTSGPGRLTVLGPLRITTGGKEISGGLRKARELLAFLAVHQDGATAEAISEALWPEADPARADGQRNLALRKARDMLRTATGLSAPMWILQASGRYRLDPTLISTDLWEFTSALDQARHACSDDARLAACQKATSLYHGELAEGAGYEWAEPYAESARRRALDAWTVIAGILEPSDPGQALATLESALSHDPYNEFLYEKIMRLQAAAGHPDAVRRTLNLLEARLTDLGITPGPQTRQVAASLLGTVRLPAIHRVGSADQCAKPDDHEHWMSRIRDS